MKIWWCHEHNASVSFDDDLPTECYGCPYTALGYPESDCRMVPMRLIPDNAETLEQAAEALYYWDDDSGSVLIPWSYENEAPHKESNRDYYRRGVQVVLAALDGETP